MKIKCPICGFTYIGPDRPKCPSCCKPYLKHEMVKGSARITNDVQAEQGELFGSKEKARAHVNVSMNADRHKDRL